jgi:hypothetical protein
MPEASTVARESGAVAPNPDSTVSRDTRRGPARSAVRVHWRDCIKVHPAAELFPMMSDDDLGVLGHDIRKNGLREPIKVLRQDGLGIPTLVDGRNRLEAMERDGFPLFNEARELLVSFEVVGDPAGLDAYGYVASVNVHRRHLSVEQKRGLIGKLLASTPQRSDRATARLAQVDHKTVAAVRADKEARGEIPHVEVRTDSAGRQQPVTKSAKPSSKGARIGARLERQLDGEAASSSSRPGASGVAGEIAQLLRVLNADPSRVSQIPIAQRVGLAKSCLKLLGVSIDDLRPETGGAVSLNGTATRSPPGAPDASDTPRHRVTTDPEPARPVAVDPEPVQSASPLADTSLMAAYRATPAPYQAKVKQWTMHGYLHGEHAPTADDGSTLPFEALWRNAETEAHKEFRRDLMVLESARVAA